MAGIGFVLRKLSRQDNLIGVFRAMAHSALASTGPWLFTVLALGCMMVLGSAYISREELYAFRVIVIYNFAFSLVFTAPIFMVATRYLADCIHKEDVSTAPGMLVGALVVVYITQIPIVGLFYLVYAEMDAAVALSAIVNFMLISSIWLIAIFLTALKNYQTVTRSFAIGLLVSIGASYLFAENHGTAGMLNGFSAGMAFTVASLTAGVFAEYNYPLKKPFLFMGYFKKYWEIALSGLIYNIAAWVDKWIMWFAPEAERMDNNLISYPNYDSAMFLAYLTIVPAMAFFDSA